MEEAEAELIKRLDTNDSWPAIGLGHIKSTRAVPKLYDLLPKASGPVKAQIATTLWRICEDGNMLQIVLDLSQPSITSRLSPFYEFNLIDIIYCLAQFPQPECRARLEELTADKRHLVSYNAKRALALRKSLYNINT
jgi:HEAT repeat protein